MPPGCIGLQAATCSASRSSAERSALPVRELRWNSEPCCQTSVARCPRGDGCGVGGPRGLRRSAQPCRGARRSSGSSSGGISSRPHSSRAVRRSPSRRGCRASSTRNGPSPATRSRRKERACVHRKDPGAPVPGGQDLRGARERSEGALRFGVSDGAAQEAVVTAARTRPGAPSSPPSAVPVAAISSAASSRSA